MFRLKDARRDRTSDVIELAKADQAK